MKERRKARRIYGIEFEQKRASYSAGVGAGGCNEKYNDYRKNLLFLVGFTVVNIILAVAGADFYMLFSASVPYYSVFLALFFADKLPVDYYLNYETGKPEYFEIPGAGIFLAVAAVIAVVTLGAYVLMWVLSKKSYIPLIVATVMFVFDTMGLLLIALLFGASSFIPDFLLHVLVLVILGLSIYTGVKKKKLERAAANAAQAAEGQQEDENNFQDDVKGEKTALLRECEQPVTEGERAVSTPEKSEDQT